MFIDRLEPRLLFTAGDLDPYFGNAGIAPGGETVLPLADGRIYTITHAGRGVSIRRLSADGVLDPTYNVTLNPARPYSIADTTREPAAVDSRGRLFVAVRGGIVCVGTNGKVDRTFGNAGVINSPLEYSVRDILVQRDDRIVLAGSQRKQNGLVDQDPNDPFFAEAAAVARLNSNGTIDDTFGTKGVKLLSEYTGYGLQAPQDKRVLDVAIDSFNRLIALREVTFGNDYNDYIISRSTFDVLRLNPDGSQDASLPTIDGATRFVTDDQFGDLFNTTLHGHRPVKLLVDSSNRIVLSLGEGDPETEHIGIARIMPDGTRDTSFGGDGFVEEFFSDDSEIIQLTDLITLADGKILASMYVQKNAAHNRASVAALNADGTRDTGFATDGLIELGEQRFTSFVGLAKDGSVLASSSKNDDRKLMRFWRDGAPAAIASVKNISQANRTVVIDVAYRDDGAIDTTTLDSHDLRVTGPNGYVKYARFDSIVSSVKGDGMVVARYKLPAPGGSWVGRNGVYDIRLRANEIRDADGNGIASRSLTAFVVNVPATSQPAAVRSTSSTMSAKTNQRDDVFNDVALIDELM